MAFTTTTTTTINEKKNMAALIPRSTKFDLS